MSARREHLGEFVERMCAAAGDNLESIILYGSGSRQDFNETFSDLNLLCLFRDANAGGLSKVARVMNWWSKELRQRPPLIMSSAEFRSSVDVFAIEILDMQTDHRVLYGADAVAGLHVSMDRHRVELERELRITLLRLRQHFMLADDNEEELKHVLIRSVSTVLTLLRHSLVSLGQPRQGSQAEVLKRTAETMGIEVAPFESAIALREGRENRADVRAVFEHYIQSLAAVVSHIDGAATKGSE